MFDIEKFMKNPLGYPWRNSNQDDQEENNEVYKKTEDFYKNFKLLSRERKHILANMTDELNNLGVKSYYSGDIKTAIEYYNKALEIFPINDDALKNLISCYDQNFDFINRLKAEKRLKFVTKLLETK